MDLKRLHEKGWIDTHKPFWWNFKYTPDPREKVSLDEFIERIEFVDFSSKRGKIRLPLYVGDKVPIVTHEMKVEDEQCELFITSRPYNQQEISEFCKVWANPLVLMFLAATKQPLIAPDLLWPLDTFREYLAKCNQFPLNLHFIPHVRGIAREGKNDTLFWNPITSGEAADAMRDALDKIIPHMQVWVSDDSHYGIKAYNWYGKVGAESISRESPHHLTPYNELKAKRLISGKKPFNLVTGSLEETAYDEFVEGLEGERQMIAVYPIRHPDLDETIPLVLCTRTHAESKRRGPTVLGVMGRYSHKDLYKIWRIKDQRFCSDISAILQEEVGVEFDVVHFEQGRYRLIALQH